MLAQALADPAVDIITLQGSTFDFDPNNDPSALTCGDPNVPVNNDVLGLNPPEHLATFAKRSWAWFCVYAEPST